MSGLRIIDSEIRNWLNKGNHGCEGQSGRTTTPSALSVLIFFNVLRANAKGEKA